MLWVILPLATYSPLSLKSPVRGFINYYWLSVKQNDFPSRFKINTTAEREREEPVMESLSDLLGGTEPPAVVPAREKLVPAVADDDADADEAGDADEGDEE